MKITSVDVSCRLGPWLQFRQTAFVCLSVLTLLFVGFFGVVGGVGVLLENARGIARITSFIVIVLMLVGFIKKKDLEYWVEITTASGEQIACYGCNDKDYALEIVEAINQAIVSK